MTIQATIRQGRLYWTGRTYDADPLAGTTWSPVGRIETVRNNVLLVTVLLYLLFNWGFMQLRIPPVVGGGLPLGEIVLLLALLTINYTRVLGRLSLTVALVPLVVWWSFGVGRAMFDFSVHGTWALRDAAHVLESLFLLVGFVFAGDFRSFERFFDWLPKLLVVAVLYGLMYPIRVEIWQLSPTITSGTGFDVPIFGSMATTSYLMIVAAIYLIVFHSNRSLANLAAVIIIGFTVAAFQARTLYLTLIAVFGFLVLYRRSSLGNIGAVVFLAGFLLGLISLIGLQFEGRLGANFSVDFLVAHFMAIFGVCDSSIESVCSAAEGVGQRLEWWTAIFQSMAQDPFSLLLGLGYGVPLTDFYGSDGAAVREPHNSYITVIARTGIVGAVCWTLILASLIRRWHITFVTCHVLGWKEGENRLMVLMVFFICVWVLAIGEDGFEKPYNIIPFYFFWGIVLRFSLLLDRGLIGPEAEAVPSPPLRHRDLERGGVKESHRPHSTDEVVSLVGSESHGVGESNASEQLDDRRRHPSSQTATSRSRGPRRMTGGQP
jgi:O-antigen ligase